MKKIDLKSIILFISILSLITVCLSGTSRAEYILEIDDPLTDGTTVGDKVRGGQFTSQGWKTLSRFDFIKYHIETCPYGKIEFDVQGLYASNEVFENKRYYDGRFIEDATDVHYTLFNMWDRDPYDDWLGKYFDGVRQWHNPYKVLLHLFGYVYGDRWKWKHGRFRANISAFSGGYDNDPHAFELEYGPVDWQKEYVYHVVLEWGQGHMYYYIDGELLAHCDYSSFGVEYDPPYHSMCIGSGESMYGQEHTKGFSMQTPKYITYSNFKFYRNEDNTPPEVISFTPGDNSQDNPLDSYIAINISESFDHESAKNAFHLSPAAPGSVKVVGKTIYYELQEFLSPNTSYTLTLDETLKDQFGNQMQMPFQATFHTGEAISDQVPKYGVFEVPIVASNVSGNKYKDVWVRGTFQGPTQTIQIDGFWNGGNIWKVRMSPIELGTWTYTINGPTAEFDKSGSFECVASDNKGYICVNPDDPYKFMHKDGTPWLWKGETCWRAYTDLFPYEGRFKEYIDMRVDQGYNVVQAIVVSYINGDAFWSNEGGPVFELFYDGKNYDRLNPGYFQWMDRKIEYMNSKGVVPVIFFTWAQEFVKFSKEQFDRFAKYLVARFAAYNVFWCISGENSEIYSDFGMTADIWRYHGRVVHNADPYNHPITYHPGGNTRSSREFGYDDWFGFIMQQSPDFHKLIERDRVFEKPVVNGEYAYAGWTADDNWLRYGAWEIFTAGGFSTAGFFHTFAPDKGGYNPDANMQQQMEMVYYMDFVDETEWWKMEPRDEITSAGYCLANPGSEYVIYNRAGGAINVNLADVTDAIKVQWLNPRTGEYSEISTVNGGVSVSFTPPFSGDFVLHIAHSLNHDNVPPSAPTGLTIK